MSKNINDLVKGEVYLLDNEAKVLPLLDEYEGCDINDPLPTEFKRVITDVMVNKKIKAWTYLYSKPVNNLNRIISGDYLQIIKSSI